MKLRTAAAAFAVASFLSGAVSGGMPATGMAAKPETHFLGLGICPPWKPIDPQVCVDDVNAMVAAFKTRLSLRDETIHRLLNADATRAGLETTLAGLKDIPATDRLIIYANLHAGSLDGNKAADAGNDVFVLWSETKPTAVPFALAEGLWITAADFAKWVHESSAGEIILILDACESAGVDPLFVSQHETNDRKRPEAVVVSARADQIANFNKDQTMGLFTEILARELRSAQGTLAEAVTSASALTRAAAVPICAGIAPSLEKAGLGPAKCRQEPEMQDPDHLLSAINLD